MRIFSYVFLLVIVSTVQLTAAPPDTLRQSAIQATADYKAALERLADWATVQKLREEAAKTRAAILPSEPDRIYIPSFPLKVGTLDLAKGLPLTLPRQYAAPFLGNGDSTEKAEATTGKELTPAEVWSIQFRLVRLNYAQKLQVLAKRAVKEQRGTLAVQLAMAGLHANPDHDGFRTVFGFIKHKGEWRTPWEAERLKKDFVDHEKFGWIPKAVVDRYEKGERYHNGSWITADDDIRRHATIETGWKIESEHYDLTTNHSIEEGVRMVRQNENLYRAWKLLFFRYMATDAQLTTLFNGKVVPAPLDRHKIQLFRDRDDFLQAEKARGTKDADRFGGFYRHNGKEGTCVFYVNGSPSTMYHESTHQLFQETKKIAGDSMLSSVTKSEIPVNYWLIEGAATFMETFQQDEKGYYVIGNPSAGRIRVAKRILREGKTLLPLSELTGVDGKEWREHEEMGTLYNQSAAMFHFLMFHDGGQLRDATIVLLRLHYERKDTRQSIVQLTGMNYAELDAAFNDFLKR